MKKVVAIASADWHIHKFKNFDTGGNRLLQSVRAANRIMKVAEKYDVPILFAGDLVHSYKEIENETNNYVQGLFHISLKTFFYSIPGNHDFSERNSIEYKSPSHIDAIDYLKLVKQIRYNKKQFSQGIKHGNTEDQDKEFRVWGVEYMNNDHDLRLAVDDLKNEVTQYGGLKILLLHSDMPGAKTPEGFTIAETEAIPRHLDKYFKEWDLVLCGHIHRPQKLSNKVYMLGSPIHQTAGDEGIEMGYWKIYSDKTMKFVHLKDFPKFIRLKPGETAPDDFNYYIKPEEVLADEEVEVGEFNINLSKSKLAKRYITKNNIKSKSKRRALIKILNQV